MIGDPLFKRLLKRENDIMYVDVPHLAVSSRLHWRHGVQYVGKEITIGK